MNEELKFQKLSDVELVEEASEAAHPLVEEDGKIKRVKGGIGGGIPVFDLTPYIHMTEEESTVDLSQMSEGRIKIMPKFTEQEVEEFIALASAGAILIKADLKNVIEAMAQQEGASTDMPYTVNQVLSTQFFDSGTTGDALMRGVCMYSGLVDLYMLADSSMLSAVGFMGDQHMAQFVFPMMLMAFTG